MNNTYLIPANTKNGKLILGMFEPFDLILFGVGVCLTLLLVTILPMESIYVTIVILLPALITGFLVIPVPNYHNMLNVIGEMIDFLSNQRNYKWKGWCVNYGKAKK
ncbi:MAG: hypothetical protein Q4E39_01830 [bacterium]|nr:hypothetical protein [bacterium]